MLLASREYLLLSEDAADRTSCDNPKAASATLTRDSIIAAKTMRQWSPVAQPRNWRKPILYTWNSVNSQMRPGIDACPSTALNVIGGAL